MSEVFDYPLLLWESHAGILWTVAARQWCCSISDIWFISWSEPASSIFMKREGSVVL